MSYKITQNPMLGVYLSKERRNQLVLDLISVRYLFKKESLLIVDKRALLLLLNRLCRYVPANPTIQAFVHQIFKRKDLHNFIKKPLYPFLFSAKEWGKKGELL